jgi:DNA-binding IclR family transcriptional regulator
MMTANEPVENDLASKGTSNMRSVERAMDLLDALARHEAPVRLADLARATGLHRATALRILNTLQHRDYVSAGADGYRIGIAFLGGAHAFLVTDPTSRTATPVLQQLAETTGLTASFHVRSGYERVVVARVEGSNPLRYELPIGRRLPLFLGAGRILAAAMDEEERRELFSAVGPMRTAQGAEVSPEEMEQILTRVREQGFYISVDERAPGTSGVSVPVRDADAGVLGVLTLSGPSEKHSVDELQAWVPELQRAASALGGLQPRAV